MIASVYFTKAERREALNKAVCLAKKEGWDKELLYPELVLKEKEA